MGINLDIKFNPPSFQKPPGPRPGEGIPAQVRICAGKEYVMKVKTNKVGTGAVRVTIPKVIADKLGIKAGDWLEVSRKGQSVAFRKSEGEV
jgi:AbrB family looped-hinge helix DNA binding protein